MKNQRSITTAREWFFLWGKFLLRGYNILVNISEKIDPGLLVSHMNGCTCDTFHIISKAEHMIYFDAQ